MDRDYLLIPFHNIVVDIGKDNIIDYYEQSGNDKMAMVGSFYNIFDKMYMSIYGYMINMEHSLGREFDF